MPKTIHKKIWPEYFAAVQTGRKNYELRLQDFEIEEGDTLVLDEWDPETKHPTGRSITKKVGYVGKFRPEELPFWSVEDIRTKGLQIISLM